MTTAYNDVTGNTAAQRAAAKLDYEPVTWYTTSMWCTDSRIRTTIRYRPKGELLGERSMDFEFEISELIGLLRAEAKNHPTSKLNYLNIVNDDGAWQASRFALINDVRIIAEERGMLKSCIQEATKERCSSGKNQAESYMAIFEGLHAALRSVALCDTVIWLSRKPKGWWAFLELLKDLQPPVTVNS